MKINAEELEYAITDCKKICGELALIPTGQIVDCDTEAYNAIERTVVQFDGSKTGHKLVDLIKNRIHPPYTRVIEKTGTAKYPPRAYYFSTTYAANVSPYSIDTAKIKRTLNLLHSYYAVTHKRTMKDVMPFIMVFCAVVGMIIITAIVFTSGIIKI